MNLLVKGRPAAEGERAVEEQYCSAVDSAVDHVAFCCTSINTQLDAASSRHGNAFLIEK